MSGMEGITIKDKADFNRDLDGYIHKKRRGSGGGSIFGGISIRRQKKVQPRHEEKKVKVKKMDDVQKYQELEKDIEEVEAEELPSREKSEKKEGAMKRFFGKFRGKSRMDEDIEEEGAPAMGDDIPEDVKDVLKTSLKWIQELPPARLKDFKNSPDFEKYKEILVKYKVAKPTEKPIEKK